MANANAKGNLDNLRPVRTKEEAKKRGASGGKKSGEARRRKRDAKQAISLLLDMAAKDNLDKNLQKLGYSEQDRTNMNALMARMFTKAMSGDVAAFKALMDYGGFHPDQKMKDEERRARIDTLKNDGIGMGIPYGDENENEDTEDVVVYLPSNGRDSE